jgi:Arm DNA-binding domain
MELPPKMQLTDSAIRSAKPGKKSVRLFDGGGLYVEISPSGGKWWRLKHRFDGKEKRLSLGVYPDVPLAGRKDKKTGEWINGARDKRDKARHLVADGIDPGEHRKIAQEAKVARAINCFEAVAREWFAKYSPRWAASHSEKIFKRLENDIFPWLGSKVISEISPPEVLKVLHRIEGRGAFDTSHRALQNCGQIFRYGVAT